MRQLTNTGSKAVSGKIMIDRAISIAAFVLLFSTILFYTHAVLMEDQEITAFLIACYLFAGVYLGAYTTLLWVHRYKIIPKAIFVVLLSLITLCVFWLLVLPQLIIIINSLVYILLFALPLLLISFSAGVLIKLVRIRVQRQLASAKAQAEHSQSELALLQSQLSPHFLFNTLNNIYGLSISRPEKIPPLLLKLSDLLRYSVYDAKELFVPLRNEIAYIENYIEFEKIRIGEKLLLHSCLEPLADERIKIAPMLLIVFVENAFKHAKNTAQNEIYISVELKVQENVILFNVKNSYNQTTPESAVLKKHSGLGLANARKRLDLLYPNAYQLSISTEESTYSVALQVNTK